MLPRAHGERERAGGMAVVLRDALRARGGLWFGWSGETAEATSTAPKLVQSGRIQYATIDLGHANHDQFYNRYSNGTLWPLLHYRLGLLEFRRESLEGYLRVNEAFSDALRPLLQPDDLIWIHDYHLIPLATALRRQGVANRIGLFLHTPFPPPALFTALPRYEVLLDALTAYDLIGMQTEDDRLNLRSVMTEYCRCSSSADGHLELPARRVLLRAIPVGVDVRAMTLMAETASIAPEQRRLIDSLVGRQLIVGVDRLDYSKGLPQRFEAYERLLTSFGDHRSQVTFMQIAPVSRGEVGQYRDLRRELERSAGRINGRFAEFDWVPLRYLNRAFSRQTLAGFYRHARVGLVTPLRDGMNLVAKEYVAAQDGNDPGVLVLSRFAGAARELTDAVLVNPYDIDAMAEAIHQALTMPLTERQTRWQSMMRSITSNTAAAWRGTFLKLLENLVVAASA